MAMGSIAAGRDERPVVKIDDPLTTPPPVIEPGNGPPNTKGNETMKAILKQLKNDPEKTGDAVCCNVPAMLVYIADRTSDTPEGVQRRLERGETVETCFATYRKHE